MNHTLIRILAAVFVSTLVVDFGLGRDEPNKSELHHVIDKAIKAHGGAEQLAKRKAQIVKAMVHYYGGDKPIQFESKYFFQAQDRFRMDSPGFGVMIVDGTRGWLNDKPMPAAQIAQQAESLYMSWVTSRFPLRDKAFTVTPLGDSIVDGKPVVGINVGSQGHRDIRIYFDKQTGLTSKFVTRTHSRELGKEVEQEVLMTAYKDFDGVPVPLKLVTKHDGKLYSETEFVEFKFFDKLDDKVFEKPDGK